MRLDLSRQQTEIRRDELPPQRSILAALALQPLQRRCDARRMITTQKRHHLRRHRLAVQPQRFITDLDAAQPNVTRQTIEAVRNAQPAQRLTCRISFAQPSISGTMVSAFSDSRLNTTRETPRS